MPPKDKKQHRQAHRDQADAGDSNPARQIAAFVENGLRDTFGATVRVKRIQLDLEAGDDEVCVVWDHPFSRTRYTRKNGH